MKTKTKIAVSLTLLLFTIAFFYVRSSDNQSSVRIEIKSVSQETDLQHRQEVWISALEWCESRGVNSALNPKDRDGTPSYSNFQWKPSTFLGYGKAYGLIKKTTSLKDVPQLLKDYNLQRDILRHMVLDKSVNWGLQFPVCTKKFVGLPPRS